MNKINLLGAGFVGRQYNALYPCVVNEREDYTPQTNNILYTISTLHNFHIFTDTHIDIDTNLNLLITTLDNARNKFGNDFTFNFLSSWSVYGDVPLPVTEDSICKPKGFYSITKKTAEDLLITYCTTFKINYRILRLANVLGAADTKISNQKNTLQYLINKIKNNEDIDLFDKGEFYRDYIDVVDVAHALDIVLKRSSLNEIYNISNAKALMYKDLINYVVQKINSKSNINLIEPSNFYKTIQVKSMVINNTKLVSLGYAPSRTIFETLDALL